MKYLIHVLTNILKIFPLMVLLIAIGCKQPDTSKPPKPIIDAYVEVWNTGDLGALDAITDPQFELRISPKLTAIIGRDALKKAITDTRTAFPDFHVAIEQEIYSGDKVLVARWTISGTNTGPGHFPPTGKHAMADGFSVIHFANGKITGEWIAYNDLDWLKQLGFTIMPPEVQK